MMYDSGKPGHWVNLGELEAVLDDLREQVDRLESRKSIRDISGLSMRCRAYRFAIDEANRAAAELARVGIMCAAIPVYNFGIVDQPGEGPAPKGYGAGAVGEPDRGKAGGAVG